MKKTIQEIQKALQEKEQLSSNALTQIYGGGCDDKRKDEKRKEVSSNSSGSSNAGGG